MQTIRDLLRKYPSKFNFDGMFPSLVGLFTHAN